MTPIQHRVAFDQVRSTPSGRRLNPAPRYQAGDHFDSRRRIVMVAATRPIAA